MQGDAGIVIYSRAVLWCAVVPVQEQVERLLSEYGGVDHLRSAIEQRRLVWSPRMFQIWVQRVTDHYGFLLRSIPGPVEYVPVAAVEAIDGLFHYDFELQGDQERKLLFAVLMFDPDVFPRRIATDQMDEISGSVYTVLCEPELITLVLSSEWDALKHAGMLAIDKQLASVAHLKELLRVGSTRSLAAGSL